jgi:hypothetical protein
MENRFGFGSVSGRFLRCEIRSEDFDSASVHYRQSSLPKEENSTIDTVFSHKVK